MVGDRIMDVVFKFGIELIRNRVDCDKALGFLAL